MPSYICHIGPFRVHLEAAGYQPYASHGADVLTNEATFISHAHAESCAKVRRPQHINLTRVRLVNTIDGFLTVALPITLATSVHSSALHVKQSPEAACSRLLYPRLAPNYQSSR
jgi:hypothetical protein